MLDLLLIASLLIFYLLGLACLALAQDKHWKELNVYSQRQAWTTPIGWGSLALSLLLAWAYQGAAFGSLFWVLLLPPSGYALAFTLAWRPQWLRPLARLLSR
ncbi:DUF3325 family protein [Pseudomonas sp.]|uniref:DUF3325 family protein n=1 Tax=Pseudomonas sp. TaxID=306 RepID=UPI00299EDE7D|nr:DUF3325 family protein [Pseudomonas sp.]MDX1366474.1 DUF3325 family protein [Pseudomonas sp.]